MKSIIIQYDYSHGPLWEDVFNEETGTWSTGVAIIDHDEEVQALNNEAQKLYSSLYSFDKEGGSCEFDLDMFEIIRPALRSLTEGLINRLSVINDGTFEIIDKTGLNNALNDNKNHAV